LINNRGYVDEEDEFAEENCLIFGGNNSDYGLNPNNNTNDSGESMDTIDLNNPIGDINNPPSDTNLNVSASSSTVTMCMTSPYKINGNNNKGKGGKRGGKSPYGSPHSHSKSKFVGQIMKFDSDLFNIDFNDIKDLEELEVISFLIVFYQKFIVFN